MTEDFQNGSNANPLHLDGKAACFGQQMRAKSQTSVGKLAVPPIQGVIHYRHRQNFFSPRTDRCCFPWMGMSCRLSGQACIRRDSRRCSLPSKNIQDWSRVDTFKLSYHDKSCPPEVTNRAGKAACFGQLMRGQSQTSGHVVCCLKVSWQCLQFKESFIIITDNNAYCRCLRHTTLTTQASTHFQAQPSILQSRIAISYAWQSKVL